MHISFLFVSSRPFLTDKTQGISTVNNLAVEWAEIVCCALIAHWQNKGLFEIFVNLHPRYFELWACFDQAWLPFIKPPLSYAPTEFKFVNFYSEFFGKIDRILINRYIEFAQYLCHKFHSYALTLSGFKLNVPSFHFSWVFCESSVRLNSLSTAS